MSMVLQGLGLAMITKFTTMSLPKNFGMKAMTAWTNFSNRAAVTNMNNTAASLNDITRAIDIPAWTHKNDMTEGTNVPTAVHPTALTGMKACTCSFSRRIIVSPWIQIVCNLVFTLCRACCNVGFKQVWILLN